MKMIAENWDIAVDRFSIRIFNLVILFSVFFTTALFSLYFGLIFFCSPTSLILSVSSRAQSVCVCAPALCRPIHVTHKVLDFH